VYKKDFVYKVSASTDSGSQKIFYIIVFAGVVMAMLFGLFAVTANPIIISLAIALLAGTILLARPAWIVWMILLLGLLVVGILPLHLDFIAARAAWGVSLLGFFLMFIVFFGSATSPNRVKDTPAFIWIALGFLVFALLNSFIQWHSASEFLGGFKRYFQVWGLLFALCWRAFDEQDIHRLRIFILIAALLQLPFAFYELIVFVPLLKSTWGVAAVDVVAGTFGASMDGGGASGEMALFLIIVLAFLLARRMERVLSLSRLILLVPILLVPLFLGETKVAVVMLPLMFLILYRREMFARLHYWLMGFIMITLLTAAMGYTYLSLSHRPLHEEIEAVLSYNMYERGYASNYLNRTTVLTFWAEKQGIDDPVSFVFGNGLGSSHSATRGHVTKSYPGYGIGLTAASILLWDMGVFGSGLFVAILVFAWRSAGRLQRESTVPTVRADAAAIQSSLVLFAFYVFYRAGILDIMSIQIVFSTLLGYLAWLYRKHVLLQ